MSQSPIEKAAEAYRYFNTRNEPNALGQAITAYLEACADNGSEVYKVASGIVQAQGARRLVESPQNWLPEGRAAILALVPGRE